MRLPSKSTTTIYAKSNVSRLCAALTSFTIATGFVIYTYQSVYPLSFSFSKFAARAIGEQAFLITVNVVISSVATSQIITPLRFHYQNSLDR